MEAIAGNLLLIALLILLNAAFAGSELAVVSLRPSHLRRLRSEHGAAGERVADLAADPSRFLSTVQVGITLGGFLASAAAAVSLAEPLERHLDFLGGAAGLVAVIGVTLVLTFVTLVFGELVPKRIALQRAEGWSLRAARPLTTLARVASPAISLLSWTTDIVVRLLGASTDATADETTEEEIRDLIAHQPDVSPTRRAILTSAFELQGRNARDILVPRRSIHCIPAAETIRDATASMVETGHSRGPMLAHDTFDSIVHLRDLIAAPDDAQPVTSIAREAIVLPETIGVLDALTRLQRGHQQMALVANEYGTITGIITVEDVLEEIVGEIYDEFDRDLNEADARSVVREADGSILLPGGFPVHDLPDIRVELPETNQATVSGLVTNHLQRIPEPGETVRIDGWNVTIIDIDHHTIGTMRLRRADS